MDNGVVQKEQLGIDRVFVILQKHFDDDERAFDNINKRFDKNDEIATINGEHMSYIGKDLSEINAKISALTDTLSTHITAVEPILKRYQDEQTAKRVIASYGKPVKAFVLGSSTLIVAWYVIRDFFLK